MLALVDELIGYSLELSVAAACPRKEIIETVNLDLRNIVEV